METRKMSELEINRYKAKKESEFYSAFKKLEKELSEKYKVDISLNGHYDILLINGINKNLSPIINEVITEIISYAENTLDEKYKMTLSEPMYISDNPINIYSPENNIIYSLDRILKEDEPK